MNWTLATINFKVKNCNRLTNHLFVILGYIPSSLIMTSNKPNIFCQWSSRHNLLCLPSQNLEVLMELRSLEIFRKNINGTIPQDIGRLTQLEHIELSHNNITGYIPVTITRLGNLLTLKLLENNLQGYIPKTIGNLSSLTILMLSKNNLSGIFVLFI